ncbi:MAG: type II secretion system protein N [Halopseudomonas sp.]
MTGWLKLNRWGARIVLLGLLAVLALLAQQWWIKVGSSPLESVMVAPVVPAGVVDTVRLDAILRSSLLGKATPVGSVKTVAKPQPILAKTRLKLRLLGVVQGEGASVAIIAHDQRQQAYLQGEYLNLDQQVLVEQVLVDRVVLQRDGRLEYLQLEAESRSSQGVTQVVVSSARPRAEVSDSRRSKGKSRRGLREQLLDDVRQGKRQLNTRPYQGQGVQIVQGSDAELLSLLQLQSGDVVMAVNGRPQSQGSNRQLAQSMLGRDRLRLDVIRGGQPTQLSLNL